MPRSEFELIQHYFSSFDAGPGVALGVGDDCALLQLGDGEQLATSVDTAVADVHFPADGPADRIAYRSIACAASDLAAMGARPLGMTLAITLPEADEPWLAAFSRGLAEASQQFQLPLVGGDTTRGPLQVCVQVFGALPAGQALLRSGASVGERVCVSGELGNNAAGLACIQGRWQGDAVAIPGLIEAYYRPAPQLALGQQLRASASAAIDISDGLLADAGHIAEASGLGIEIRAEQLPLSQALRNYPDRQQVLAWALSGGDDYQLLFTLPAGTPLPAGCSEIGVTVAGQGVQCDANVAGRGFKHFE